MINWFINDHGALRSGWKVPGFFLLLPALIVAATLGLNGLGRPLVIGPWLGAALGALASLLCVRLEGRPLSSLGFALRKTLGLGMALRRPRRHPLHPGDRPAGAGPGWLPLGTHAWYRAPATPGRRLAPAGCGLQRRALRPGLPLPAAGGGCRPLGRPVGPGGPVRPHALAQPPGMDGATKAWATLNIGLAAILLGFCYLRTRSLALPIGLHLGWNWAQGSLLGSSRGIGSFLDPIAAP